MLDERKKSTGQATRCQTMYKALKQPKHHISDFEQPGAH